MKSNSSASLGAFHPVLFFSCMYIVALVFAIFFCSSLFHAFNARTTKSNVNNVEVLENANSYATINYK
ncbi:MAG: hypothetical protein RIR12_2081 [Bacteroidota bacterium]|jgi:hypothetical protein